MNRSSIVTNEEKALAAISYLGWLVIIPILLKSKHSNFVKKHINCAITLMIISIVTSVIIIPIFSAGVVTAILFIESSGTTAAIILFGSAMLFMAVSLAMCIIQWVALVRAALGYEGSTWKFKTVRFISMDE